MPSLRRRPWMSASAASPSPMNCADIIALFGFHEIRHYGYLLRPGLAHFLEHMLFLGTKTFPDEQSFDFYLSAHGGESNAYTAAVDTNYYFLVRRNHLMFRSNI